MKAVLSAFALSLALFAPVAAAAGPIERACNRSDRPTANRALGRCVDSVARDMLTRSEQRRAARMFRNPDETQRIRMSRNDNDREFWRRYREWGTSAEARCAR